MGLIVFDSPILFHNDAELAEKPLLARLLPDDRMTALEKWAAAAFTLDIDISRTFRGWPKVV